MQLREGHNFINNNVDDFVLCEECSIEINLRVEGSYKSLLWSSRC